MSKNFSTLYASTNVSTAIEQSFFIKEETTRGELIAPTASDFLYTLAGGGVEFSQPITSSPHRSGRHHTSPIKGKKECSWTLPMMFNIDTTLVAPATGEIDTGVRVLYKSLMGSEDTSSGLKYLPKTPDITFSLFENGDKWARQVRGCFVQEATLTFPGDGEAGSEWSGNAKDALYVGIGKSIAANDGGNTITLVAGDGKQFTKAVGALVMIIEANGTTRSADTPDGSPRSIVSVVGDVVTLSGAALADADGSGVGAPIYLAYYEPVSKTGINNPQTGLQGSVTITGYGTVCARSVSLTLSNNHELINYCYGEDSLSSRMFVPADRFTAAISMDINLDKNILSFFNGLQNFEAQELQFVLGDSAGRHLDVDVPKAVFQVPTISVPETGSIPVTFEGTAYQTALDAEDEISIHFK